MPTPDEFPGKRIEEELEFTPDTIDPTNPGGMTYRSDINNGEFRMKDNQGIFNPRTTGGALPSATQVGQLLFTTDGSNFTVQLPLTNPGGWLVNDSGTLLVVG